MRSRQTTGFVSAAVCGLLLIAGACSDHAPQSPSGPSPVPTPSTAAAPAMATNGQEPPTVTLESVNQGEPLQTPISTDATASGDVALEWGDPSTDGVMMAANPNQPYPPRRLRVTGQAEGSRYRLTATWENGGIVQHTDTSYRWYEEGTSGGSWTNVGRNVKSTSTVVDAGTWVFEVRHRRETTFQGTFNGRSSTRTIAVGVNTGRPGPPRQFRLVKRNSWPALPGQRFSARTIELNWKLPRNNGHGVNTWRIEARMNSRTYRNRTLSLSADSDGQVAWSGPWLPEGTWTVTVQGQNSFGWGPKAVKRNVDAGRNPDAARPGGPRNVNAQASDGRINITWIASPAFGRIPLTKFLYWTAPAHQTSCTERSGARPLPLRIEEQFGGLPSYRGELFYATLDAGEKVGVSAVNRVGEGACAFATISQ